MFWIRVFELSAWAEHLGDPFIVSLRTRAFSMKWAGLEKILSIAL